MNYADEHDGIGQEPRKVWINKLLNKLDAAWYPLFTGNVLGAIGPMRGVIQELDAHSKNQALESLLKQLEDYERRAPTDRLELERIYGKILSYLHSHQLKEFDRGIDETDFEKLERKGETGEEE